MMEGWPEAAPVLAHQLSPHVSRPQASLAKGWACS